MKISDISRRRLALFYDPRETERLGGGGNLLPYLFGVRSRCITWVTHLHGSSGEMNTRTLYLYSLAPHISFEIISCTHS